MDKKRPSGEQNLVAWARPYLAEKRKLYQLVDPRLELNYSLKGVQKVSQLAYNCLSRDPKSRPTMDEVVKVITPLQDLNDLAILSYHSRMSQQGRRKKKSDGEPQITYTQSKSMRDSPLNTGKQQNRWEGQWKWTNTKDWDFWHDTFLLTGLCEDSISSLYNFLGCFSKFAWVRGLMEKGNVHYFPLFSFRPFYILER